MPHARVKTNNGDTVTEDKKVEKIDSKLVSKYPELFEPHTFAPKDLLALLKNLEHEIGICETSLKDENDKRNKYKVSRFIIDFFKIHFILHFQEMIEQNEKLLNYAILNCQWWIIYCLLDDAFLINHFLGFEIIHTKVILKNNSFWIAKFHFLLLEIKFSLLMWKRQLIKWNQYR